MPSRVLNEASASSSKYRSQKLVIKSSGKQHHHFHRYSNHHQRAFIIGFSTLGFGLLLICVLLAILWYNRVKSSKTSPYDLTSIRLQRFSYRELKSATGSFNSTHRLGKGGFGVVYRGVLRNGKEVAVKRMDMTSLQGEREFQNELSIIGGLRSPFVVSLFGYCSDGKRRLLVYEHMQNRSLQEALFENDESPSKLDWEKRFKVILDTAQALAFLHVECDPPIVHGDIKPSNILLDANFNARLADFGLARVKCDVEYGPELFSQDLCKSQDLWKSQDLNKSQDLARINRDNNKNVKIDFGDHAEGSIGRISSRKMENANLGMDVDGAKSPSSVSEVDFSLALQLQHQASSSTRVEWYSDAAQVAQAVVLGGDEETGLHTKAKEIMVENHPSDARVQEVVISGDEDIGLNTKGKEIIAENCLSDAGTDDLGSIDRSKDLRASPPDYGLDDKDLKKKQPWGKDWWWRQDGSGELSAKDYVMEWIGSQIKPGRSANWDDENKVEKNTDGTKTPEVREEPSGELTLTESMRIPEKSVKSGKNKHKKFKEWWKEEYFAELNKKNKKLRKMDRKWKRGKNVESWRDECFSGNLSKGNSKRYNGRTDSRGRDWKDDHSGEISFGRVWRNRDKKKHHSMGSDMWSGDLLSRDLSSTTSMRGTVCYIAPEYGGCGYLSEKGDIYSFGVLMLVIISGRRPLHILASPMKDFEKANLITWARHLAQTGNILDLVDENLRDVYNRDQASLCITLALLCLQRIPEMRPDIAEIVKILKGEIDAPDLPLEFSPSPPCRIFNRSRRKLNADIALSVDFP
ncbi:hypothetical protein SUGI_0995590 [Cryptomeria japonica]|uniref:putative receptor-like protein kinase At1g80870 n=1 Tax=Cryptomeria japonica TaxID=3369 RepID=UPI002414C5AF|nr:putative receptor-like protein kinase At1g80870 [Cryptomeria japonica]GLJ47154.1 hypothetical protein SUGI_0995590 [Cryptomeria japonica]